MKPKAPDIDRNELMSFLAARHPGVTPELIADPGLVSLIKRQAALQISTIATRVSAIQSG